MAQHRLDPSIFNQPPSNNPFRESRLAAPSGDEESTFAMVQTGPAVTAAECEREGVSAVELTILWGTTILAVRHLEADQSFSIGTGDVDFAVPEGALATQRHELVSARSGVATLSVPAGASLAIRGPEGSEASQATELPLTSGTRCEVELGALTIRLAGVTAGKRTARRIFGSTDNNTAISFGATSLFCGALMGMLAFFVPPLGLTEDDSTSQDRIYAIQQYLASASERERERTEDMTKDQDALPGSSDHAEGAKGESGKMGKVGAPDRNKKAATRGPADNPDPHMARVKALRDARSFGMIGILNSENGSTGPTVPWGRDTSLGTDPMSADGNMWGDDLGESGGSGGLGLSGIGTGGGFRGESIGLGAIGTCGSTVCGGLEHGFGNSVGRPGASGHQVKSPKMRIGQTTVSSGTLPADVIQRIVRQNYGRFRMCYEGGLRSNPNLSGRVAVSFVISRDGAVSHATNAGSDLPDSSVVGCVVSAYYGLSFPAPKDGIVTVNYPIQFSPG